MSASDRSFLTGVTMRIAVAMLLDDTESSEAAEEIERLLEAQGGGYGLLAEETEESIVSSDEPPTPESVIKSWGTSAGVPTLASPRMLTVGAVAESSLSPLGRRQIGHEDGNENGSGKIDLRDRVRRYLRRRPVK